ncbi:ankyrin repeat-containing domain protein [Neocallimastix sp. 'constans']
MAKGMKNENEDNAVGNEISDEELNIYIEKCIKENNLNKIKNAIENKPNYKEKEFNKNFLIISIQQTSDRAIIEYFINNENNFNYEYFFGKTPLGEALNNHNFYIADILLKKKANINYINSRGQNIFFYLNQSKDKPLDAQVLKYLIKNGANYSWKNLQNMSYLDCMLKNNNIKFVDTMLNSISFNNDFILDILLNVKNKKRYSREVWYNKINEQYQKIDINKDVIKIIIKNRSEQMFDLILKYTAKPSNDKLLNLMMHLVCREKNVEFLKKLIKKGVNVNCKEEETLATPLMELSFIEKGLKCINQNIYDMFVLLIEAGADINARDANGKTALMHILSTKKVSIKLIKFLIKHGAEVNDLCKNGYSPLIYACQGNKKSVIKSLIELGANIEFTSKDGKSFLIHAAMNGCIYLTEYLIENNIDKNINYVDKSLKTPLMYAVQSKNLNLVKYLIENGANINFISNKNQSALSMLLAKPLLKKGMLILNYLVDHGADINRVYTMEDNTGIFYYQETPLIHAIKLQKFELIKFLVDHGADVNTKLSNGNTAIYYAIIHSKPSEIVTIVNYLLEKGAHVNEIINENNETPLFEAVKSGNHQIIQLLIDHGANINHKNKDNNIAMRYKIYKRNVPNFVSLLVNEKTNFEELNKSEGRSLFHYAITYQNEYLFNYIMNSEAFTININHKDSRHFTPLMLAVGTENINIITKILERKPKINEKSLNLETALHIAVERRNLKITKLLIEHGAKIDNSNVIMNKKMLFNAIPSFRIIQLLVKHGFTINDFIINSENDYGEYPLSYAVRNLKYSSVNFLLANGANFNNVNSRNGKLPLQELTTDYRKHKVEDYIKIIECFMQYGADINAKNEKGETLLFSLLNHYSRDLMNSLIKYLIKEQHADYNVQNNDGITFLMSLVHDKKANIEIIKYLIDEIKIPVDITDNNGNTVLMYAFRNDNETIYNYFFNKCKDFNCRNNHQQNLLMYIIRSVDLETIKYLVQQGININDVDDKGRNALFYLCQDIPLNYNADMSHRYSYFAKTKWRDIFKYLVQEGIDVNCIDDDGRNILFYVNDIEMMKIAMDHGAEITHLDHQGRSVLFTLEYSELLMYAMEHGVDASIRDVDGHTALYTKTTERFQSDTIKYLLQHGADINDIQFSIENHFTLKYSYTTSLINQMIDLNFNFDTININDKIENENKNENNEGIVKETFLDYLIFTYYYRDTKEFVSFIKKAIDKNLFDINRKNFIGDTPLLYLMRKLNQRVIKDEEVMYDLLLYMADHGASLDEYSVENKTPLYYALIYSADLSIQFYNRGARILSLMGRTKVIINVKNILLHEKSNDSIKCEMIRFLQYIDHIDFKEKVNGIYPIFLAIENKCYSVINYLISEKASLSKKNDKNETVMDVAKRIGDQFIIQMISEQKEWIDYEKKLEKEKEEIEKEKEANIIIDEEEEEDIFFCIE